MPFFGEIHRYCELHTTKQSELLYNLDRETNLKTLAPQMISGHLQGQLLTLLSQFVQPEKILEIGTFTGYATICLAKGLRKGGKITTIEANSELEYLIKKYFDQAELWDQVNLIIGDALAVIPKLEDTYDLVFIDAAKADYETYYDLVIDRVRPGGVILADNVLWDGKVLNASSDVQTQKLQRFNKKVQEDERVDNTILPVRDGILIARKR